MRPLPPPQADLTRTAEGVPNATYTNDLRLTRQRPDQRSQLDRRDRPSVLEGDGYTAPANWGTSTRPTATHRRGQLLEQGGAIIKFSIWDPSLLGLLGDASESRASSRVRHGRDTDKRPVVTPVQDP